MAFRRWNTPGSRYFCPVTIKIHSLCPFIKQKVGGNGANPAKFIQQRNKRKRKAAQFTHRDTGKNPKRPKRNRDCRFSVQNPYLCCVFLPFVSPLRYLDRRARFAGRGLFLIMRIHCPYMGRQTGVMMLRIIVHIQFAIIPRFGL